MERMKMEVKLEMGMEMDGQTLQHHPGEYLKPEKVVEIQFPNAGTTIRTGSVVNSDEDGDGDGDGDGDADQV